MMRLAQRSPPESALSQRVHRAVDIVHLQHTAACKINECVCVFVHGGGGRHTESTHKLVVLHSDGSSHRSNTTEIVL